MLLVAAAATLFVVGCGGGADPAKQAIGKWGMQIDASAMPEGMEKKQAEAAKGQSIMTIEVKDGGTADISVFGQKEEASWTVTGSKITITPKKSGPGSEPINGTISSDGKRIDLEVPKAQADQMKGAKLYLAKEEASAEAKK